MILLYISYWSSSDPLTHSTVIPHLRVAASFQQVESILLITVERNPVMHDLQLPKTEHIPLKASSLPVNVLARISDFMRLPPRIAGIARARGVSIIMAKGVLAGRIAYSVSKKFGIPFITESFEPHADYMTESEEWRHTGFKFLFLKRWEMQQIRSAEKLLTVSDNYKNFLVRNFGKKNVLTLPCTVDLESFRFDGRIREATRIKLNIKDEVTGIYTGRFGGIYYKEEAFDIFAKAAIWFKNFRLIILTPDDKQQTISELEKRNISRDQVSILYVPHAEVAAYLSASDFAFSTIKPARSRKYCSPVKNGEYWANGLPILLTHNVGDDASIMEEENGGSLFDLRTRNLDNAFEKINAILKEKDHRQRISRIAARHRSSEMITAVYREIFGR
jgi:glycosyltransferase involved in cell wall biosynthesis